MAANLVLPYVTQILTTLYTLGEELEEDEYGTNFLCLDKSTGEACACNSISKANLLISNHGYDAVWREIQIMHRVSTIPTAVAFRNAYEDSERVYLVTELCEGGHLLDRILDDEGYCERDVVKIMTTIVEFVQSCHSLGVMHRDLRLRNLVFQTTHKDSLLKLTGFRSAAFFHSGDTFKDKVGSPNYMAPEILKNKYGPEIDIWSVGIILHILLSGVSPFRAENEADLSNEILNGTLDLESEQCTDISDNAKDLIRKMLDKDPKRRPSAYYVLCHPWITSESNVADKPLDSVRSRLKTLPLAYIT